MAWQLYTKFWTENSIGEHTEGPWVLRGTFDTKEDANAKANEYSRWSSTGGCWAWVKEVPSCPSA